MSIHQKVGIVLESKVVQKLNLEKMFLPKTTEGPPVANTLLFTSARNIHCSVGVEVC